MRVGSAGTRIDFTRCAYTPGLAMTGNANLNDDGSYRLNHYRTVFRQAIERSGLEVSGGCR